MNLVQLIIFGAILAFVLFYEPAFCFVFNIYLIFYYAIKDTVDYIIHCRWRECKAYGHIIMCTGLFGKGKTLDGTHEVRRIYHKYNGKKIYVDGKWGVQNIHILSNVKINDIPYVRLNNAEQIVELPQSGTKFDVWIVYIDEASTQFNSRNFKTNISATLLNAMLTCRHHKFGMILTAQRFMHVDALIRQITEKVFECHKVWRFMIKYEADAWDMENATNVKLVNTKTRCWFVRDDDYNSYDTSAVVEDIKRKQKNGELLTDAEVLDLQGNTQSDLVSVGHKSKLAKKYCKL